MRATSLAMHARSPLRYLAVFMSGLTLVTAMAVLAWAILVAHA
jgi:hypothetical protein